MRTSFLNEEARIGAFFRLKETCDVPGAFHSWTGLCQSKHQGEENASQRVIDIVARNTRHSLRLAEQ